MPLFVCLFFAQFAFRIWCVFSMWMAHLKWDLRAVRSHRGQQTLCHPVRLCLLLSPCSSRGDDFEVP